MMEIREVVEWARGSVRTPVPADEVDALLLAGAALVRRQEFRRFDVEALARQGRNADRLEPWTAGLLMEWAGRLGWPEEECEPIRLLTILVERARWWKAWG